MRRTVLRFISPLLAASAVAAPSPASLSRDVQTAMRELRRDEFRSHMAFLSDDLLEGRGTGTRGHELAARYIASQFEAFGLRLAGADGTYYQRVPLREISVDADRSELTITRNGTLVQLAWGADFLARGHATNPDALVDAPVVFVGYGVQTWTGASTLSGVDVKNKIVAMRGGGASHRTARARRRAPGEIARRRRTRCRGCAVLEAATGGEAVGVGPRGEQRRFSCHVLDWT
jgi:hypothetical protein